MNILYLLIFLLILLVIVTIIIISIMFFRSNKKKLTKSLELSKPQKLIPLTNIRGKFFNSNFPYYFILPSQNSPTNTTLVHFWDKNAVNINQDIWEYDPSTFKIKHVDSGLFLTVSEQPENQYSHLHLYDNTALNEETGQKWIYKNGKFSLKSNPDLFLSKSPDGPTLGSTIFLNRYNGDNTNDLLFKIQN